MDYFEHSKRVDRQRDEESKGLVADSLEYRKALIARWKAGKITHEEMLAELKRVQRGAKAKGQVTRAQAYRGHMPDADRSLKRSQEKG